MTKRKSLDLTKKNRPEDSGRFSFTKTNFSATGI
jgi:hypothetical protein